MTSFYTNKGVSSKGPTPFINTLRLISNISAKLNMPISIRYGQVLFLHRDGQIWNEHDNDFDFGIPAVGYKEELVELLESAGWEVTKFLHKDTNEPLQIYCRPPNRKDYVNVDFYIYDVRIINGVGHEIDYTNSWKTDKDYDGIYNKAIEKRNRYYGYTEQIIEECKILVPNNMEALCEEWYGADWRIPKNKYSKGGYNHEDKKELAAAYYRKFTEPMILPVPHYSEKRLSILWDHLMRMFSEDELQPIGDTAEAFKEKKFFKNNRHMYFRIEEKNRYKLEPYVYSSSYIVKVGGNVVHSMDEIKNSVSLQLINYGKCFIEIV